LHLSLSGGIMNKMLFEPLEIGSMTLKNRIGLAPLLNMPGVWTTFMITEATIKWFEHRAKGGAGLIMTGSFILEMINMPGAKEQFTKMADAVHVYGAKLGVQITTVAPLGGVGPSPMPYPDKRHPKQSIFEYMTGQLSFIPGIETINEITKEEIARLKEAFPAAAKILKQAGVDCVELHCAHGGATLCCSFISPFYNRREDEYGGCWENRLRFPVETIKGIRAAVGPDYPILARIDADELLGPAGITVEDTIKFTVPALEAAGISCFDVSQGSIMHSPEGIEIPLYYKRGCFIHHAEAVKKATNLPVIGVGRIVDLDMAEKFLQEGKADIIYLGRQLTSDPETPNKYAQGRADEIRKCIGCLEGCGTPCPINYDIFPDAIPLTPAEKKKKILIIGGGVAGMEAARVCSIRGHQIVLIEKEAALGGTVAALAQDPLAAEFKNFVDYLGTQMRKLNVDVRVCREADPKMIEEIKPDAVILATGASLRKPELAENKPGVIDHVEALKNRPSIGQKVVVWGLMYGAEFAISLAREGKEVTLIGEAGEDTLASHAHRTRRWWILRKLVDISVVRASAEAQKVDNPKVFFHIKVEDITPEGILITDKQGKQNRLPFDTLIISRGRKKNDELFPELEGKAPEVYKIGDCANAANILGAVWSANELARKI
jgi:2,4-dienoyl-CoA reductase-like NADH-dependent reductase (Old Yellow Enzyme family)/thioredoxin reductase